MSRKVKITESELISLIEKLVNEDKKKKEDKTWIHIIVSIDNG